MPHWLATMRNWLAITALSSSILPGYSLAQIEVPDKPRCYFPDGSLRNSTDYQPCNNVAGIDSMCCAIANRGSDGDTCLSNGLCAVGAGSATSGGGFALWRETCTDPTWKSPACLKICMSKGRTYDWLSHDAPVTLCQDGTVCCGGEVTGGKCCSSHSGFQLPTGIAAGAAEPSSPTTAVRSTSTSTSIATSKSSISSQRKSSSPTSSTAAPASPSSPASTPSPPSPSSTNTIKIAIGASVPVVVIAAAAAAYFAWRRRSRRKGPRVYEKDTKGPVEIGTSNTFFQPTTKISAGDPARSRQSVHELQGISAPVHHINVHEMQ